MPDEELEETSEQMLPHQLKQGAQFKKLQLPVAGMGSSSGPGGLPDRGSPPTGREAQRVEPKSADNPQCYLASSVAAFQGSLRSRPPWSGVTVDVRSPYTKGEGRTPCAFPPSPSVSAGGAPFSRLRLVRATFSHHTRHCLSG